MFSSFTHWFLGASLLAAGLLSGCTRRPPSPAKNQTVPTLTLPAPIVSYLVTRADGFTLPPDGALAAAEANQLHSTLHVWLLKHAHRIRVALPTETVKPAAANQSDAAWARALAASEQTELVLITHLYHQRVFRAMALQSAQTIVTQATTTPGTVINIPVGESGPSFTEELSIDLTLYRATGEVVWKYSKRDIPGFFHPSSGSVADHLVETALSSMPLSRKVLR